MGLFDLYADPSNPPAQTLSPNALGLLGAMAALGQASGPSRMPVSNGQVLGAAAGGFGRGYLGGQQGLGQAQKNALTAAQLGFYKNLYPMLPQLLGTSPSSAPSPAPSVNPSQYPATAALMGPSAVAPTPSSAPPTIDPVARAERLAMFGGMTGMKGLSDAAKMSLDYSPGVQAQIAGAKAGAQSSLAVDIANYKSASQAGNANLAAMWANKARYDSNLAHTAGYTGTTTQIDPLTGRVTYSFNPSKGTIFENGLESLVPGAANAARTLSNAQGAGEAAGKLAYEPFTTVTPTGPNAGRESKTLGKDMFPDLGMNPAQRAANGANPGAPVTKLSPAAEELSKSAGEQAGKNNESFQAEAENAKDQNAQIATIQNAASTFGPGQFAQWRSQGLNYLNSAGLISSDQLQRLGSAQEGTKIGIQLQAAATKTLGSREAQQIFQWMGKSMPNLELSSAGLEKISSFMKGMNDYKIARAQMAQEKFNQNDAVGVNSIRNDFIKNSNPLFYIMADSSPDDRLELLRNMGPAKAKTFVTQWDAAVKAGYAPGLQ